MKIHKFFQNMKKNYIVAEVSQNHDGSLGQAHAFIDAVAGTGADAIKFQTHIAEEESTPDEPFRINFSYCDKTRYDYWKRMEFTPEQWQGLYDHAIEKGLDFLSSPFSTAALQMLDKIGVPAWKFGSGEVFNDLLLRQAIDTGKPIILSSGLSTVEEMDKQVKMVQAAGNPLLLMECTTAYPSKPEEIPIKLIDFYQRRYHCPIGISDHSSTIYPSLAAAVLGARAFEVHVTMSREMFGPDVKASVTIEELKQIVEGTEFISKMLDVQEDKREISDSKKILRNMFSKSIYAKRNLSAGEVLKSDSVGIKKPFCSDGIAVEDYDQILGKRILTDITKDTVIRWESIEI
ncbi:MAG: N-acetylneuraminate synthase family protein [Lachnospiraceae bacterium]|nr:N-acetylneuraminate synthase family protein [Lachnospiraceae bacterium]